MKTIKKICSIIGFTIFIVPLGILFCVIVGPFYMIILLYKDMFKKLTLNEELKINGGNIFLLYADHNEFDFDNYFKKHNKPISCIKITDGKAKNDFGNYLSKDCTETSFPSLVKIDGKNLIYKDLNKAFKQLVKRNNNPYSFYKQIKLSSRKLKKETYKQV
ncbi:hypothetical protein [Kordia jejudonensis]|uniref:hypothetical protein n=1 Tax=Kordia jejudonensis TaxID=1348245 RepID=UPI0006290DC7|nr:hypothetical protein [Kordia jejudonensis]